MAARSKLQFIILGLLAQENRTGYDLTQAFADEIGEFWQAGHSQIYPLLARMQAQGLIDYERTVAGTKLEKKLYHITAAGRTALSTWIASPTPELAASKDEFVLKLYFIDSASDPDLPGMLSEQLAVHEQKIRHLEARQQLLFSTEKERQAHFGHYLILDHALRRERHYKAWLDGALKQVHTATK